MPDFVSGDNDAAEAAGVLDDGHAVDLLKALVHDARASDISEACDRRRGAGGRTESVLLILVVGNWRMF